MTQLVLSIAAWRLGMRMDGGAVVKVQRGLRGVLDYNVVTLARALGVGRARQGKA